MPFQDLPGVETCCFRAREYLMRRGDIMEYVYYLKRGVVKREVLTPYGSEMINTIKEGGQITGSIVGLLVIFDKEFDGYCTDNFIAVTDCICYRIPVAVCRAYLHEHSELLEEALSMAIESFNYLEGLIESKQDKQAPQLICEFLLDHGESCEKGLVLPKHYSNVEIAKYLGIHSVTVSRIISALRKDGLVMRIPEGLFLCNTDGIRAYLHGLIKMKYD